MPISRFIKYIFNSKKRCVKKRGVNPVNETYGVRDPTDHQVLHHTIVNFSKCNVPFRNTLLIKPLFNNDDQLAFLMGISYPNIDDPPLHITPSLLHYDKLISEFDELSFSIVLTTCSSPFLIKFANKHWLALSGYKLDDVLGKTFGLIQGTSVDNAKASKQFKNKILLALAEWEFEGGGF
jgi:hypothetical protein